MTAVCGDRPLPMDIESVIGMLPRAWDRVLARRAGPGIDGMTVETFRADAPARLRALGDRLRAGMWQPRPGRRLRLEYDRERPIVVPTVEDRIVQRAVALVLSPWVEPELGPGASAYRPGHDMGSTTQEIERHIRSGRVWFARTDIEKFFDRLDRDLVQAALLGLGAATEVVAVIVRLLGVGAIEGLAWHDTGEGVSQGSALSPILSNLYLAPVDRVMAATGALYFRYADDVLVLAETEIETAESLARFGVEIETYGLRLNARKTTRGHVRAGLDYLGVRFDGAGRAGPTRGLSQFAERVAALVAESPDDLTGAATIVGEYERWYGALREAQLASLAVLAAWVARFREAPGASGLEGLARCRVERFAEQSLPPAVHVQLVEAWISLGDAEEVAAAVLTDARAALAGRLTEAELGRLVRALGIVAPEL